MGDGKEGKEGVYPKPMFDFSERRDVCLGKMKKAYEVGLYGDDCRVLDGSWRNLFEEFPPEIKGKGRTVDKKAKETQPVGGEVEATHAQTVGTKRKKGQTTLDNLVKRSKR